ncbi:MAG: Aspartate carbamoyltransferase [Alphaproteobacteria bacterium MarineAlpha6_Bin4]|nr:MAG: Aspartate carbamoyltransferase [Alphaproteobacteria bacterium MarineAlpha6_Bin5]PPR37671.1 MAG: Aspartate carbamoyltransferase [Alphaproteobacteria bacterium MarineAlpha6_Bin4]|tara:strand:+ start:3867 stop:4820 length:954 start_codon:yes stop_codon:yes gene_type:complete
MKLLKDSKRALLKPHLLSVEDLSIPEIDVLLNKANFYADANKQKGKIEKTLKRSTVITLFFETSTRTKTSFELAAKRLGANSIGINASSSAIKKGETLIDTAMTLNAMHADVLIVRHPDSGAVKLLSKKVNCAVINAGDGTHEHPTQALLDALTIKRNKKKIKNLNIAICGDVLHSRVARSNILLLSKLGARLRIIAPPTLIPKNIENLGIEVFTDMKKGLVDCDIVMMLRLQMERMKGLYVPSTKEYFKFYGLDHEKLKKAKKDALIMHPGPMNRGIEIDSSLADNLDRSLIHQQVEMGVAIRMACLEMLTLGIDK